MEKKKLSIIIPVFNEAATIAKVLDNVKQVELIENIEKEIIVVNDGSTDDSYKVIKEYQENSIELDLLFLEHLSNKGKGASIKNGIARASGDFLIVQDADLEYDPNEYNLLLKPVLDGHADVVYGSRFMGNKPHRILFFWHSIGNKFLTFLSNMSNNLNLTDMESCYKLFKMDIIKSIKLKENRFGFEPEVTSKISRIPGIRIYEVGISYYGRTYKEGKKINWKDGVKALFCIVKYGMLKIK